MLFKSRRLGCFFTEQFGNLDFCVIEIILKADTAAFLDAVYCFTLLRRANGLSRFGQLLLIKVGALGFATLRYSSIFFEMAFLHSSR